MSERGPVSRIVIPVLCIGVTAAGLMNVYGDHSVVEKLAEQTACGAENCSVKILEQQRSPFSHQYRYQTSVKDQTTAAVECAREYVLVGEYRCEKK